MPELLRCGLRRGEVFAERGERLAALAPQRVRDRLFRALEHTEPDGVRHKARNTEPAHVFLKLNPDHHASFRFDAFG